MTSRKRPAPAGLRIEVEGYPSLFAKSVIYDVIKTKGVVRLTNGGGIVRSGESGPSAADDKRPLLDDVASYWELQVTHGHEVLASVLSETRYFDWGQDEFESEMREAIEKGELRGAFSTAILREYRQSKGGPSLLSFYQGCTRSDFATSGSPCWPNTRQTQATSSPSAT